VRLRPDVGDVAATSTSGISKRHFRYATPTAKSGDNIAVKLGQIQVEENKFTDDI